MANAVTQPGKLTALLLQLRQRIEAQPLPEPEDSVWLRVLVQILAAVGIVSIDLAAADVAEPLWISIWAIPVSAVGAVWSWHRRRHRNVPIKFCIAIAMLIGLAAFFLRLLHSSNDTRLALAELLIQLQVFHSFDLPRRKDLGYSIVIGLILLGVSATLSQTLAFAPLLVLFLAIALPTLILDYRSRLGLMPRSWKRIGADLSPQRLGFVLCITIALGLLIFAVLPRLPGYQLRTFPVSSPIEFEGQFNSSTIINPGYVREGRASDGFGTGADGTIEGGESDEFDENSYYGFNSRINQNLRGELLPKVVMRVRSQAPGFWRVMAFDRYIGQGWEVSRNEEEQIEKIERPTWTFRFNLPWSVSLSRTEEVVQSFTIVSDLPNLLPALYEPKELYFPTRQVGIDAEGAVRSPIPLSEGLTYTVVSEVPYRDRTLLRQSPTVYPVVINRYYLDVPEEIVSKVRQKTEEIFSDSPTVLADPYEKTLYLAQYLKQNYTVQPDLPPLEEREDLVEAFLFKHGGGYPDHFSTVLTIMLRSVGIPARLVVGFNAGEFNPFTGYYIVRNTDAYAMTEVFFAKYGWFSFNPIPGFETLPVEVSESQTFSVLRQFWNWIAGWLPSPVTGFFNQIFEWITQALAWAIALLSNLFSRGWVGLLLGLGTLCIISFAGWLLWSSWQSWRYRYWLSRLPPMEALYQQLLRWLAGQGFHKAPAQTPLEYADHLRHQCSPVHAEVIAEISQAYVYWRYGRQEANLTYLKQQFKTLQKRSPNPMKPHPG
jgi:transglutaminase-like putative cysteine protease